MHKGYRRIRHNRSRRSAKLLAAAIGVLALSLLWVWKSNQVKENYAQMKRLETERGNLISENMKLKSNLQEIKSLSAINKIVTEKYGLTHNVSRRIFLTDPVMTAQQPNKLNLVGDMRDLPDWIDNSIFGSGRVRAESENK
jgi:hypothetical protein